MIGDLLHDCGPEAAGPAGWRKDVDWPQTARSAARLCPAISARREIAS
jgi:hypothetical protein